MPSQDQIVEYDNDIDECNIEDDLKSCHSTGKKFPTRSVWPNRFLRKEHLHKQYLVDEKVAKYLAQTSVEDYEIITRKIQVLDLHVTRIPKQVTPTDAVLFKYFPGKFVDFLPVMNAAAAKFLEAAVVIPKDDCTRGEITSITYHFGRWERRGNPEGESSLMKYAFAKQLVKDLEVVSTAIDGCFQRNFKQHWLFLNEVLAEDLPGDVTRVYRMFALNDSTSDWHVDYSDFVDGFCAIIPFGKFEGGDLLLPDINMRIPAKAGDLIFLRSQFMVHKNAPVTQGHRRSLVYYTHQLAVSRYLMRVKPQLKTTQQTLDYCRDNWSYKKSLVKKNASFYTTKS